MTSAQTVAFVLALLSVLRLTRLAIHDTIAQPWRDKLILGYARNTELASGHDQASTVPAPSDIQRLSAQHARSAKRRAATYDWFSQLFGCPWCIGFWISAAVSAITLAAAGVPLGIPAWYAYPAYTLALSYLTGVVYTAVFTLEEYDPNK